MLKKLGSKRDEHTEKFNRVIIKEKLNRVDEYNKNTLEEISRRLDDRGMDQ